MGPQQSDGDGVSFIRHPVFNVTVFFVGPAARGKRKGCEIKCETDKDGGREVKREILRGTEKLDGAAQREGERDGFHKEFDRAGCRQLEAEEIFHVEVTCSTVCLLPSWQEC